MRVNDIARSPDFVLFFTWLVTILVYLMLDFKFPPLSFDACLGVFFFIVFFSISYRGSRFIFSQFRFRALIPIFRAWWIYCLGFFSAAYTVGKVFYLVFAFDIGSAREFRESFMGDGSFSVGAGFSFPLCIAAYMVAKASHETVFCRVFVLLSLVVAVLSTAKLYLILWAVFFLFISNVSGVRLFFSIFCGVGLFFISSFVLGKFSTSVSDGYLSATFNTLVVYWLGGFAAFLEITDKCRNISQPDIVGAMSIIFGEYKVPGSFGDGWIMINDHLQTNVYSAFTPFFLAMKGFYPFFLGPAVGFYYGFFFARNGFSSRFFLMYRIYLIFVLVFTVFNGEFLSAYRMHIGFLGASFLVGLTIVGGSRKSCGSFLN